ncbi:MAG: chloroperoxidase [Aureliella sp.]
MTKKYNAFDLISNGLSIESLEPLVLLSASCGGDVYLSVDTPTGCDETFSSDYDLVDESGEDCDAISNQTDVLPPSLGPTPANPGRNTNTPDACFVAENVDCLGVDASLPRSLSGTSGLLAYPESDAVADLLSPINNPPEVQVGDLETLVDEEQLNGAYGSDMPLMEVSAQVGVPDVPQNAGLGDAVLRWNDFFGELLVLNEAQQNPGYASRAMAMLNVAMYDAVTIAQGDSDDTFFEHRDLGCIQGEVDAELAAGQAAYSVLSSLYSGEQEFIDAFHHEFLACMSIEMGYDSSVQLGDAVGEQVLEARANDGSGYEVEYEFGDQPGDFRPDPLNPNVPVWGPSWGDVKPFSISSTDDFSPPTTPSLNSVEYAASFNEVKELGSVDSTSRTAEQTEIGIFWAYDRVGMGTPMALFGNVLESVALKQGNSLEENAALFAQASVSMADAGIVAWDTKFSEEFWRPVTAIREGDLDGNALTYGDQAWTALGAPDGGDDIVGFTPQFPTYISGHATFGGALFGAIRDFYGTDDIAFDVTSKELEILMDRPELQQKYGLQLEDATRSFDSLRQAMAENGRSRVYLGIHFDFDDIVGREVGEKVASAITPRFSVPSSVYDARSSLA